jgi:hypothetical protein
VDRTILRRFFLILYINGVATQINDFQAGDEANGVNGKITSYLAKTFTN